MELVSVGIRSVAHPVREGSQGLALGEEQGKEDVLEMKVLKQEGTGRTPVEDRNRWYNWSK